MEEKWLRVISSSTFRGVIDKANELNISKDEILSIYNVNGQFMLVYYK